MTANILGNHKLFTNEQGQIHTCVDNAMSCLGKCIYKHGASIDADPIKAFLAKLPLVIDEEEARVVHLEFMKQIQVNPVFAPFSEEVKSAVKRLLMKVQEKPDLEILCDEGKQQLQTLAQSM